MTDLVNKDIEDFLLENDWNEVPFKTVHPETLSDKFTDFGDWQIVYGKGNIWIWVIQYKDKWSMEFHDMTRAGFSTQGYFGWIGYDQLIRFDKEPTVDYLKLTLEHFKI